MNCVISSKDSSTDQLEKVKSLTSETLDDTSFGSEDGIDMSSAGKDFRYSSSLKGLSLEKRHLDPLFPLRLQNQHTRCFIDAVLQLFFSLKEMRQLLFEATEKITENIKAIDQNLQNPQLPNDQKDKLKIRAAELENHRAIIDAIKKMIEEDAKAQGQHSIGVSDSRQIIESCVGKAPESQTNTLFNAAEKIRQVLIESNLCEDLSKDSYYAMQDAAPIAMLLIEILSLSFQLLPIDLIPSQELCKAAQTTESDLKSDKEIVGRPESHQRLVLHLKSGEENHLSQMIKDELKPELIKNEREIVVGGKSTLISSFKRQHRIQLLPNFMVLAACRFEFKKEEQGGVAKKLNEAIVLPKDGRVDIPFYDNQQEKKQSYELTGYVSHIGSGKTGLDAGHYVACVKMKDESGNDRYFECDNNKPSPFYKKIEKADFYRRTDAYLLMLKKIDVLE